MSIWVFQEIHISKWSIPIHQAVLQEDTSMETSSTESPERLWQINFFRYNIERLPMYKEAFFITETRNGFLSLLKYLFMGSVFIFHNDYLIFSIRRYFLP